MTRRCKKSNKTILPEMVDRLIERLEELSDENMGSEDIVRAYEALNSMNDILNTITMSKHRSRRPVKEALPKQSSYGIKVKVVDKITWL